MYILDVLTFEELTKGFDQLESHVFEQATNVMVGLDRCTRALEADTLYHVRIERSLEQPLDLALVRLSSLELGSLLLKYVYKRIPDNLAFLLRIFDAFQAGKEAIGRIDDGQVHTEVLVKHDIHLRRLVPTEHPVIDHDGMESSWGWFWLLALPHESVGEDAPVANGFVHQFRSDSAIDPAADGAYNSTSFTTDFADTSNFLPYELLLRGATTGASLCELTTYPPKYVAVI